MELEHPAVLLALIGLAPYIWHRLRRMRCSSIPFAPVQHRRGSRWQRVVLYSVIPLEAALIAGAMVAIAGPRRVSHLDRLSEEGIDLALALDISASMQAADFAPTRLEALKDLARDLVLRGTGNRVAVYAFARHVFTQTPLTSDHRVLLDLLDSLSFESISHGESGGTAVGDALLLAADSLVRARVAGRDQVVVLITDGESNLGAEPLLGAHLIASSGLGLHVIGIGGDEPVEVWVHGKPFVNTAGETLKTRLDDRQLREVAEVGGGRYWRARDLDVLTGIFAELAHLERTPLELDRLRVAASLCPELSLLILGLLSAWVTVRGFALERPLR